MSDDGIKMLSLKDVSGYYYEDGLTILSDFEITIEYTESEIEKDTILYTLPNAGEIVYIGQMVKIYVSRGYRSLTYENLLNELYSNKKDYLLDLVDKYEIKLEVNYKDDNILVDGLIYNVEMKDFYVDKYDSIVLTVINNPKTVILPDFMGWYYVDVLNYAIKNQIKVEFIYIPIMYITDFVVGQSVKPNTTVLKNNGSIIVYLAKEN